jgi:hypothetical protein
MVTDPWFAKLWAVEKRVSPEYPERSNSILELDPKVRGVTPDGMIFQLPGSW